jgi:hypothetical protein
VLVAYVDIALEHHKAISLRSSELNGSAFALVRVVFDAYVRALWINKPATAEQIEQASRDELWFPKMSEMLNQIKQEYLAAPKEDDTPEEKSTRALADEFFDFLEQVRPILNSYTHSGGLQISRRFTEDKVRPNYTDGEIAQMLSFATVTLLLLHMFFVVIS